MRGVYRMKFNYKFSNLCGTVYRQGNLIFTPDGNSLLSPVGNRISVFDIPASYTLPCENRKDIHRMTLSPNGVLLISVDQDGRAVLINFPRKSILHNFNFKERVEDIKFSPDGDYIAVALKNHLQIWKTPGTEVEFAPFVLFRTYPGHYDDLVHVCWSLNSRFILTSSKDMTSKIFSLNPIEGFSPITLVGHKDIIVSSFFSSNMRTVYTISRDGALYVRDLSFDEDLDSETLLKLNQFDLARDYDLVCLALLKGKYQIRLRHYFQQNHARVVCAEFHSKTNILVVGFDNGVFGLYELPDFNNIHSLSISSKKIDTLAVNCSGEWLAFGSSKLGQLLVWEWQSESYVLKQQGHFYNMNCLAYSPDGQTIATGGDDGKVKLWNSTSGFCFVTFSEHTSAVTGLLFTKAGHVLITCSLDGTIRAFDLVRYRNFKTFTSPSPVQFSCVASDSSGEIVCAGCMDSFEIYAWSMQTGNLLDILSGHEGPVSGLAFSPDSEGTLASCSWDKTVKIWSFLTKKKSSETFLHSSDALTLAFRPDGKELCVATLDGHLSFWDPKEGVQIRTIEGRKDIMGGRKLIDTTSSRNAASGKAFTTISYSADGECILAGGNSKYVCIYKVSESILLRRFQISHNRSLDGISEFLNSKLMTEAGSLDLINDVVGNEARLKKAYYPERNDPESDQEYHEALPGVNRGDFTARRTRLEIRTRSIQFSPTNRSWAAASTEGLLIFSLDETLIFDPYDLEIDVTPHNIIQMISKKCKIGDPETDYLKALVMSLRLNEQLLIKRVYESIHPSDIPTLSKNLPLKYLPRFLGFVARQMNESSHLEFHLRWMSFTLEYHGGYLKTNCNEHILMLKNLQKSFREQLEGLSYLCDRNRYYLEYLLCLMELSAPNDLSSDMNLLDRPDAGVNLTPQLM